MAWSPWVSQGAGQSSPVQTHRWVPCPSRPSFPAQPRCSLASRHATLTLQGRGVHHHLTSAGLKHHRQPPQQDLPTASYCTSQSAWWASVIQIYSTGTPSPSAPVRTLPDSITSEEQTFWLSCIFQSELARLCVCNSQLCSRFLSSTRAPPSPALQHCHQLQQIWRCCCCADLFISVKISVAAPPNLSSFA